MRKNFKVDFMILGAQKCGTTSLANMLKTHPKIVCCSAKEPEFFSTTADWKSELSSYESLYPQKDGAIYFEASTNYTMFPLFNLEIWDDLHEYNPELKFIYIVRNPIERIVSAYVHTYERNYTDLPFEDAVFRCPAILYASRYFMQISPFIKKFGEGKIKILFLSDFKAEQEEVSRDLASFLDVNHQEFESREFFSNTAKSANRNDRKWDRPNIAMKVLRKLTPAMYEKITKAGSRRLANKPIPSGSLKRTILDLLEDDIVKFEQLTGRKLPEWRT